MKRKKSLAIIIAVACIGTLSAVGYIFLSNNGSEDGFINDSYGNSKTVEITQAPKETETAQTTVSENEKVQNTPLVTESVKKKDTSTEKKSGTLKNFLENAMKPVGQTLYIYGGGWNEEDTGAGKEAVTIGLSPTWKSFYESQGADYDSDNFRYQIEKGLDCSGYIGWVVYNTIEKESGNSGYVYKAEEYADVYSSMGFGTKSEAGTFSDYRPGDILSSKTDYHAWISLGQCSDGSVVLVNSSPPGVRICGTATPQGNENSEAVKIAEQFMREQFPDWYEKFPDCKKGVNYLTDYDRMRWDLSGNRVLTDPEGYCELMADETLTDLFLG